MLLHADSRTKRNWNNKYLFLTKKKLSQNFDSSAWCQKFVDPRIFLFRKKLED
jgi:hypothetical protein